MPPSLFNLVSPLVELRQVSPDLRSQRYADAVRRADPVRGPREPVGRLLRQLAAGLAGVSGPSRLAAR